MNRVDLSRHFSRAFLILLFLVVFGAPALAASELEISQDIQTKLGLPKDLVSAATRIAKWVIGFIALVVAILIIYGGFTWMTAAGNEEKISLAKKTITAALIGLIVVLLAWAITWFVTSGVLGLGRD